MDKGRNPMRWNCEKSGCFNKKCRPKIELFKGCFGGKISFGDVDAMVEVHGRFLVLEWKSHRSLKDAQIIAYRNLTAIGPDKSIVVCAVCGDAETMKVEGWKYFANGNETEWRDIDFDGLCKEFQLWNTWCRKQTPPQPGGKVKKLA